jgi:hypothetical protein
MNMRLAGNLLFLSAISAAGIASAAQAPQGLSTADGRLWSVQAQTACPTVVDPVCATKNGKRIRYNNACEAERDGATNITKGDCEL